MSCTGEKLFPPKELAQTKAHGQKVLDVFTEHKQLSVIETKAPVSRDEAQKRQHFRQGKDTARKITLAACRVENGLEEGQTVRKEIGELV